jgi:hypothetical protein
MLFTGYIDESDTHGRAPDMTMSAMLSTTGRWERCDRAYARLRKRFGFEIFHATEFRRLEGEFANWSEQMCVSLLEGLGQLSADHLTECFTVHCKHEVYKTHFLEKKPAKMHRISQYGICFLGVLDGMTRTVIKQGRQHRLSVVVEGGHKNALDTARLFIQRKERLERSGIDLLLSHTLAGKSDVPLLQLADVTAHGHTLERRVVERGDAPAFFERPIEVVEDNRPGWTVAEVTPEYLAALIEEYQRGRTAAAEEYVRRKQAWLDTRAAD